jgi:hypothetical protein
MAIRFRYNVQYGDVSFRSGNFYEFGYKRFENDPEPMIIFMYHVQGIHPRTGHFHNYIQAINLSYIPKNTRHGFVRNWVDKHFNPRTQEAYRGIKFNYPADVPGNLKVAIRRYFIKGGYISNPHEIRYDAIDARLAGISGKDYFSRAVIQRARRLLERPKMGFKKKRRRPAPTPPRGKAKARRPAKVRRARPRKGRG